MKLIKRWWNNLPLETQGNIAATFGVLVWAAIIFMLAIISQRQ